MDEEKSIFEFRIEKLTLNVSNQIAVFEKIMRKNRKLQRKLDIVNK